MKLDLMSVVVLVFCLGVCVTLVAEARTLMNATKVEVVVAKTR